MTAHADTEALADDMLAACRNRTEGHTTWVEFDSAVEFVAARVAEAHEDGVRQAISWLRDAYPYGTGPEWRENGAEWIEGRLAEHRRAALDPEPTP